MSFAARSDFVVAYCRRVGHGTNLFILGTTTITAYKLIDVFSSRGQRESQQKKRRTTEPPPSPSFATAQNQSRKLNGGWLEEHT